MLFVIFLKNGGVNFIFYILKPKAVAAAGNKADASWNFLNYTLNRILLMDGNFFFSVSHTGTWTAKIRGQPEALKGGGERLGNTWSESTLILAQVNNLGREQQGLRPGSAAKEQLLSPELGRGCDQSRPGSGTVYR